MKKIDKNKFDEFRKNADIVSDIDERVDYILKVIHGKKVYWEYNVNCHPINAYLMDYIYVKGKRCVLNFPYPLSYIGGIPTRWLYQDFEKEVKYWKALNMQIKKSPRKRSKK